MNLYTAHNQWASRPDDERFQSLGELRTAVHNRRQISREATHFIGDLEAVNDNGELLIGNGRKMKPSNWAWNQMCGLVKAPAAFLGTLSVDTAAACINESIANRQVADRMKIMRLEHEDGSILQAITSTTYGRIWDADVVDAVSTMVERTGNRWYNPKAYAGGKWGAEPIPSGLYASDRDVFVFMIDGGSVFDVGPRAQISRGFMVSNSEVGKAAFNLISFGFNHCCGNHIIWGAQDVKELRIIHSSGGPNRYVNDAMPFLLDYTKRDPELGAIKRAQSLRLLAMPWMPHHEKLDDDWAKDFAKARGFTRGEVREAFEHARTEDGKCDTLWDLVQGFTATAREIPHIDVRVALEKRAGALLELAVE